MNKIIKELQLQISKKACFYYGLFAVIFALFILVFFMYNRTFPITEGWYSNYAKLINSGKVPYKDFECLFPPLYMYIIALITKIFGYKIIVLRFIGMLVFLLIGIMAYLIFTQVFSIFPSVVAAILSALYLQSEVAQVYYDYIRFMDLSVYISIFFLIKYIHQYLNQNSPKIDYSLFFCGLFASIAMQFKQSSGTIYLLYIAMFFIVFILLYNKKQKVRQFCTFILGVSIPIILLCLFIFVTNTGKNFIQMIFIDAMNAKGGGVSNSSIFTLLFGWIGRSSGIFMQELLPIVILTIIIIIMLIINKKVIISGEKHEFISIFIFSFFIVLGLILCFLSPTIGSFFAQNFDANFLFVIFTVQFLLFIIAFVVLIKGNRKILPYFTLSGVIFSLGYAVTTSGGLSESQSALALGFILATMLQLCMFKYSFLLRLVIASFALMLGISSGARKYVTTYSWWGLSEADLWSNTYETNIPYLEGIFVSESSKNMLEGVVKDVVENSNENDSIFCFPHIPIFYVLTDRSSETFTQVQWFDVASSNNMCADMDLLRSHLPKIIVKCNFPEYVKENHELMFNSNNKSTTRLFEEFLTDLIGNNQYIELNTYLINSDYSISVYSLQE